MSSRNKRRNKSRNKKNTAGSNGRSHNQSNRRSQDQDHGPDDGHSTGAMATARPLRPSTETKRSLRTTELALYAVAVLAVVMAALAVDADGDGGTDPFGAEHALRYITFLTIGYMLARGLAKAGSHGRAGVRDTVVTGEDLNDDDLPVPPGDDERTDVGSDDDLDDDGHHESAPRASANETSTTSVATTGTTPQHTPQDDEPAGPAVVTGATSPPRDDTSGARTSDVATPGTHASSDGTSDEGHLRLRRLEPPQ
jgi:hypothetical protein